MAQNMAKASERVFNGTTRVDVDALSPQARYREVQIILPDLTQNTQTFATVRPVTVDQKLIDGYAVFRTAPAAAGGTATVLVEYVASDGSTATTLVAATSVLSRSNLIPFALVANSTAEFVAGGSIRVSITTSNHAVGTQQVGGSLVLRTQAVEDSPITD